MADPDVVVERSDRPDREGAPRRLEERVADGFDTHWIVGQIDAGERPVILVCGGADTLRGRQLTRVESVLGGAVAGAAGTAGAAVIDGGTDSGVMRLVGAARERDLVAMPVLVGVAPSGEVKPPGDTELGPNHSHAVLAEADHWGDETPLMFDIAAAIAGEQRVVVVLAGGNDGALDEAVEAVRRSWPVIVIERTGGSRGGSPGSGACGASGAGTSGCAGCFVTGTSAHSAKTTRTRCTAGSPGSSEEMRRSSAPGGSSRPTTRRRTRCAHASNGCRS